MTTTWHDVRDQLNADQISSMERLEACSRNHPRAREMLLATARHHVQEHLRQTWLADVPWPAGAVTVGDWIDEGDRVIRPVFGTARGDIQLIGLQHPDGRTDWELFDGNTALTRDTARQRLEQLAGAVDELDQLSR